MKKNYIALFILFFSSIKGLTQVEVDWLKSIGGKDSDFGYTLRVDSNENVFVVGQFRGTVSFDPNSSSYDFTAGQFGDIYLQKFDKYGQFLWAKVFLNSVFAERPVITIDEKDNVYISSTFKGAIDLDPNPTIQDIHNSTSSGDNTFLVKLDNDGNYVWGKSFENVSSNQVISPSELAVDNNGNVLMSGQFQGTVNFNFNTNGSELIGEGQDGFLLKVDCNGDFVWVKQFAGDFAFFHFSCLVFDSQNNIIAGGAFKGSSPTDFDPGPAIYSLSTPGINNNDLFVLKLSENGDFIWVKTAEGYGVGNTSLVGDDRISSIAIDNNDNILFFGSYRNILNLETGTTNFILDSGINGCSNCVGFNTGFIAKMDSNANMLWAKKIEGNNYIGDLGNSNFHSTNNIIKMTNNNELYACFTFRGDLDYSINGISQSYTGNINRWGMAYCKMDPQNGDFLFVHPVANGITHSFLGYFDVVAGSLYATGIYSDELFFDTNSSLISTLADSGGHTNDAFVVKYNKSDLSSEAIGTQFIKIYPNPTPDFLYIQYSKNISDISVVDINGRKMNINKKDVHSAKIVGVESLSAGIYFLRIRYKEGVSIYKFIKK